MKDVKKYRLVPLSYSPTKNEAEQETIEKKLRDILEDRELSSSEKLARYEDALKRRDLGSMQEVKETTRPIPSLPTIPKIGSSNRVPDQKRGCALLEDSRVIVWVIDWVKVY